MVPPAGGPLRGPASQEALASPTRTRLGHDSGLTVGQPAPSASQAPAGPTSKTAPLRRRAARGEEHLHASNLVGYYLRVRLAYIMLGL